jgi:SecD/SecF fusion protein
MNSKNLPLKFALFVLLPILLSIFVLYQKGLKEGIDLRGGHSLVFEIRTNDREVQDLQGQAKNLEQEIAAAKPEKNAKAEEELNRVRQNIDRIKAAQGNEANLPERIIAILKNRIDPHGLLSLEWRPMGRNRIEVRMPAARKETQTLQNAYLEAITNLETANIQPSSIGRVMAASGPARQELIGTLVPKGSEQAKQLETLAGVRDQMNQLQAKIAELTGQMEAGTLSTAEGKKQRDAAQAELGNIRIKYSDTMESLQGANINAAALQATLRLYVSQPEKDTLKKDDVNKRTEQFDKALNTLLAKHQSRAEAIKDVVAKYEKWADSRQGLDDPSDLKRLIAKSGVLEFRIAPQPGKDIDPATVQKYLRDLQDNGPDAGKRRNDELQWFPIRGEREGYERLVVGSWGGKEYLLLHNRNPHQLLRGSSETWRLTAAYPGNDQYGRPAVDFQFDSRGAKLFYALTNEHIGKPMAILLDDEVYSAPNINSAISDRGIIEGKFTDQEVQDLVKTLEAGSLPARLATEDTPSGKIAKPVSENTFGPSLGAENLRMATWAGMVGVIAVSVFMIGYYHFAGLIAVFAMLMNLVLTLGAMGLLNAVLTLPGIAGLILAVGMAVDANVLIYERLREEQEKGQSVRMALKNGYERAFSAIFDSNITTLLSCLILGWLGSEEIRGFAITLGLGVVFNLFTAVTVTRWIFQWMLEKRLITKPLKLFKIIGVPNVDWMGKRYYFWAFSGITMVLGIVSLFSQGSSNIWGIEFSSGTQSVIRFHDDTVLNHKGKNVLPDDLNVAEMLGEEAALKGHQKFKDTAKVEQILDPNHLSNFLRANFPENVKEFASVQAEQKITASQWKQAKLRDEAFKLLDKNGDGVLSKDELAKLPTSVYQVATTESRVSVVSEIARAAFGKEIAARSRLAFKMFPGGKVDRLGVEVGASGWAKITPAMIQTADKANQPDLTDFEGGAVFVVQDVSPAVSTSEMVQRISNLRAQPDFSTQMLNPTKVIDLNAGADGTASSFAVLIRPAEPIGRNEAAWNEFIGNESKLLTSALIREEALETTNFDPAIAGEMETSAIFAIVLAWVVMMGYLWVRFGSSRWGVAALLCVFHDLIIMVGMVALSGWLYQTVVGKALLIEPFKIDLTMIAALLTIIGYSVNDTIVVFDRIRENRGKLLTVSPQIINHSINQTLSRTILTPTTVILTVLIMYIWGGPGIHAFNYAMLIGILFGTYSSIAVAAPLLMGFKEAVMHQASGTTVPAAK